MYIGLRELGLLINCFSYFLPKHTWSVHFKTYVHVHCGHTTTAIKISSLIQVLRYLSHRVRFLHLITDKRPKMLGFRLIFVHQIQI